MTIVEVKKYGETVAENYSVTIADMMNQAKTNNQNIMKTYKTKLIYPNTHKIIEVSEYDAKVKGNIYNYIAEDARNLLNLQRIEVEMHNETTGGTYITVTYDRQFEAWKDARTRIERIDNDGTRERFYIGKSTGWIPCYLEIKRRDSSGGGTLYESGILTTV